MVGRWGVMVDRGVIGGGGVVDRGVVRSRGWGMVWGGGRSMIRSWSWGMVWG